MTPLPWTWMMRILPGTMVEAVGRQHKVLMKSIFLLWYKFTGVEQWQAGIKSKILTVMQTCVVIIIALLLKTWEEEFSRSLVNVLRRDLKETLITVADVVFGTVVVVADSVVEGTGPAVKIYLWNYLLIPKTLSISLIKTCMLHLLTYHLDWRSFQNHTEGLIAVCCVY